MNKCLMVGRLTKDTKINVTPNGTEVLQNTIAVNRKFKNTQGETEADFINFVAFGPTAKAIADYCEKGDRIGIEGRWQNRSYQNQQTGQTVYVSELIVESMEFLQDKKAPKQQTNSYQQPNSYYQYQQNQQDDFEDPFKNVRNSVGVTEGDLPF